MRFLAKKNLFMFCSQWMCCVFVIQSWFNCISWFWWWCLKCRWWFNPTCLRCCGAKPLLSRGNLLGEAAFHMTLMDLTEAIIICEIKNFFYALCWWLKLGSICYTSLVLVENLIYLVIMLMLLRFVFCSLPMMVSIQLVWGPPEPSPIWGEPTRLICGFQWQQTVKTETVLNFLLLWILIWDNNMPIDFILYQC
jgi:hypothetical protein